MTPVFITRSRWFYIWRPIANLFTGYRVLSSDTLTLKFDGPALKDHAMDVTELGPSLAALGELCKEANYAINGEKAGVRVLINADIKANCVTMKLVVVQTIWNAVKDLAENKDLASAKNLMEWLGLVGIPTGSAIGLIKFLMWKKDKETEIKKITQKDGSNLLEISIKGDNNTVLITPEVFKLAQNPRVINAAKQFVAPIREGAGIEEAVLTADGEPPTRIDQKDAAEIQQATPLENTEVTTFTAHLTVYAPVLDEKVKKWRFLMNKDHPYMDISATTIAADTMKRGRVTTGDSYTALIEKTEKSGKDPEYKILKVLEFRPGQNADQGTFFGTA